MYDGIFLSQHCIRTEVKVLPPAEDPIATPRMSQSEVTSPCSCDHAIAKIYLQKCDDCRQFCWRPVQSRARPIDRFYYPHQRFCKISCSRSGVPNRSSVQHERLMETSRIIRYYFKPLLDRYFVGAPCKFLTPTQHR